MQALPESPPAFIPPPVDAAPVQGAGVHASQVLDLFAIPETWPSLSNLLEWCEHMRPGTAAILIAAGIVHLLYGQGVFRILLAINLAILGAYFGGVVGSAADAEMPGALIGAFILGASSWPLFRCSASLLAGVIGFSIGASLWRTFVADIFWASGGLIGGVFLSMLVFITFRTTTIILTGLLGSIMLILGMLGLLYQYEGIHTQIDGTLTANHFILPLAVFIPALLGVIFQHSHKPAEKKD